MTSAVVEVVVTGGLLVGSVNGSGPPVLMLHGGPGLSGDYLRDLEAELVDGYTVATYQQRGLEPTTAGEPYDLTTQAHDVATFMDALGWESATVIGHSFGGHLLLHVMAAYPERLTAAIVVDPLGGVGDGGEAQFDAEMSRRSPREVVKRAEELDRRALAGEGSESDALEAFRLFWPAYFADPASAPPAPTDIRLSVEAYSQTFDSVRAMLPSLAERLIDCPVPTVFVHGAGSPMPVSASSDTAEVIGDSARVDLVERAGHFIWFEAPGAVRRVLDGLFDAG